VGWRFRKSVKILPGVRLNFGKGGFTSTTLGGKWLKTNLSGRGTKHTFSVPGTGVSYQTDAKSRAQDNSASNGVNWVLILLGLVLVLVLLVIILVGTVLFLSTRTSTTQRPDFNLPARQASETDIASRGNF
jgi:hypothetical protein